MGISSSSKLYIFIGGLLCRPTAPSRWLCHARAVRFQPSWGRSAPLIACTRRITIFIPNLGAGLSCTFPWAEIYPIEDRCVSNSRCSRPYACELPRTEPSQHRAATLGVCRSKPMDAPSAVCYRPHLPRHPPATDHFSPAERACCFSHNEGGRSRLHTGKVANGVQG